MTKIKICGLTRLEDIEAVNTYLPDYIGFVFAKSKRQLSLEKAKSLKALLNPKIQAVGVFVNESVESIIKFEKENVIDMIQLHGDEDEDYMRTLRLQTKLPIIKALRIKEKVTITDRGNADFLLLDKHIEGIYGGGGQCFDWNSIEEIAVPYFLAGGINLDNVYQALVKGPYAIDVSSGVETHGVKDKDKIGEIVQIVKGH